MVSTPFSPWPAMCAAASSRRRARVARERRGGARSASPETGGEGTPRGGAGEAGGEAGAIAAGGGELVDGVRQGVTEAVEAGDAGKLGGRDAKGRLFH